MKMKNYKWKRKDCLEYMQKTHNKFFFYVFKDEIPKVEEKLGMELEWRPIVADDLPKELERNTIVIELDIRYFAEIEKNEKNLRLLKISFDKRISNELDIISTPGEDTKGVVR